MPDVVAARAAQAAVQSALTSYRALVKSGAVPADSAMIRQLTRVRDNATREVRAIERGLSGRTEHRRQVRARPREGGLTQYQREERGRAEKIRRTEGYPNRYQRDKARIIAEALSWSSFRWATRSDDPDDVDVSQAALFVDNFTVGRPLTPRREGKREQFIDSADRWSWRLWRDDYDRHGSGAVRIRYAIDAEEAAAGRGRTLNR